MMVRRGWIWWWWWWWWWIRMRRKKSLTLSERNCSYLLVRSSGRLKIIMIITMTMTRLIIMMAWILWIVTWADKHPRLTDSQPSLPLRLNKKYHHFHRDHCHLQNHHQQHHHHSLCKIFLANRGQSMFVWSNQPKQDQSHHHRHHHHHHHHVNYLFSANSGQSIFVWSSLAVFSSTQTRSFSSSSMLS